MQSIQRHCDVAFLVDNINGTVSDPSLFASWKPYIRPGSYTPQDYTTNFIHKKTANVLWLDGHVAHRTQGDEFIGTSQSSQLWWGG